MRYALILCCLIAGPAAAQTACVHSGQATIKMGGVDLADMRCVLETAQQTIASDAETKLALTASYKMLQSDLAASRKETAAAQAEVAKLKAQAPKSDQPKKP